jgi:anaerobic magnesium-protoporphyrin IX monomethyl ester cyclase
VKQTDCFLIGHYEIGISRHNQLIRLLYGKNSKNYSETAKYNLSHIRCEDGHYSPAEIFNLVTTGEDKKNDIADTFSLTIAYLASYLHQHGFTFDYINTFHKESDRAKLATCLEKNDITCIAITTTYYLTVLPLLDIMKFIRRYNSRVKIIIGGPYITSQVKFLGEDELHKLLNSIGADYYVHSNEGEYTLAKLVNAVKHNMPLQSVNNLIYKENGRYVKTRSQMEANDMNEHFVDWSLFRSDIRDIVNIRTTKSCPFHCSFCSFPGFSGKYRVMDLDRVEKELNTLRDINPHLGLDFIDDTFNIPKERFKDLLRMMIRNKYEFKWYCFFKAQLADRESVRLMKEAGCVQIFAGCESGSQVILDNLVKQSKVEKYLRAFEYLHQFDILSIASFIVGFPGETEETYAETLRFIEKAQPTFFRSRLWWYDTTAPVYNDRQRFELTGSGYEWQHYTMNSNDAQQLADKMILSVKSSIHATDYPIPFEMITKGVPIDTVKRFMGRFRDYLNRNIEHHAGTPIFPKAAVKADFSRVIKGEPSAIVQPLNPPENEHADTLETAVASS